MISLTKIDGKRFILNHNQIEHIETIPEVKITMMNREFYIVQESVAEIIKRIAEYNAKVMDIQREIMVTDKRK